MDVWLQLTQSPCMQGARSILGGIQNLQLASDYDTPTILIRQQGKLPPPLLTSSLHRSNLKLSDSNRHKQSVPAAEATQAVPSPVKPARLGPSALKASAAATTPMSSSLLTGRLNSQSRPRPSLPSALGTAPGSPSWAPASLDHMAASAGVVTPADTAAGETEEEAAQSPVWTQEQWDAYMQSGSAPPASAPTSNPSSRATGRKKAVKPVLKKQRMSTIVLD